jgi:hypothetical protein
MTSSVAGQMIGLSGGVLNVTRHGGFMDSSVRKREGLRMFTLSMVPAERHLASQLGAPDLPRGASDVRCSVSSITT